jgi:4-hydroxy-tetrahydrodipicolinate synthase
LAPSIGAGEFYKFTDAERKRVLEIVMDEAKSSVQVWPGVSHLGTAQSVELAKYAADVGADGIIAMPALYGKEAALAIPEHYKTILEEVDIPLMIQDSEDFNGIHICPTVYNRLAREFDSLVSVKVEGGRSLEKIKDIQELLGDRLAIIGGFAALMLLEEFDLGTNGSIPGCCLTDLLVDVYTGLKERRGTVKANFSRYKKWVYFGILHMSSFAEFEKETLRLRGVIKSSHTRSPHVPLGEQDKLELRKLLAELALV